MPELVLGPRLQWLHKPGRVCTRDNKLCGWVILRRRRKRQYLYVDVGGREVYLGPADQYPALPVTITIEYAGGYVTLDIDKRPQNIEELLGTVKSLAEIKEIIPDLERIIDRVLAKYKLI